MESKISLILIARLRSYTITSPLPTTRSLTNISTLAPAGFCRSIIELASYLEDMMANYEGLLDMKVLFSADLGTTQIPLNEILKYEKGSTIDLQKPAGASVRS